MTPDPALLLGLLGLAFHGLWRLDRRRAWPGDRVLPAHPAPPGEDEVVALVPARNEAALLPTTLPTLLDQAPWVGRVLVVDDRSSDGTAEVVRRVARARGDGPPVEVVRVDGLPAGWRGKVHALERGRRAAAHAFTAPAGRRWLLLTDADIAHAPGTLGRLLARAREDGRDLVSVMARLRADSAAERLVVPAFVAFFQALYPFDRVADDGDRTAAAAGGCVLLRWELLERADLFASMQDALIDDVTLARRVKGAGGRLWLGLDAGVRSVRSYAGLGSLVRMIARSAYEELGRRAWKVPVVVLGLLALFTAAPVLLGAGLAAGRWPLAAVGAAAWALQALALRPAVGHHRVPGRWALAWPLAALVFAWATLRSWADHVRGRGGRWR